MVSEKVSEDLRIVVKGYSIGWAQEWVDVYRDWYVQCDHQ